MKKKPIYEFFSITLSFARIDILAKFFSTKKCHTCSEKANTFKIAGFSFVSAENTNNNANST